MFKDVIFEESTHTYYNKKTKEKYKSCTQVIGNFKTPFDTEAAAQRVADREGVTPEFVIEEWDKTKNAANDKGNRIHKVMEDFINDGKVKGGPANKILKSFRKIRPFNRNNCHAELLLYNHKYKVAGTADVIEDIRNDRFNVWDFKTNKEFKFENKYNDYLLKPVHHLQNCEYNVYALQLSIYAFLYSQLTKRRCQKMGLCYYDEPNDQWYLYHAPYMFYEAKLMLEYYFKSLNKN